MLPLAVLPVLVLVLVPQLLVPPLTNCRRFAGPPILQLLDGKAAGNSLITMAAEAVRSDPDRFKPGDSGKGFKRGMQRRKGKPKRSEQKTPAAGSGFGRDVGGLNYSRQPKPGTPCDCGSGSTYAGCCSQGHAAGETDDVLKLLRARYTAYKYRQPAFLIATTDDRSSEWRPEADHAEWTSELLGMCDRFCFEGLHLIGQPVVSGDTATAIFSVELVEKGSIKMFIAVETSSFIRRDGKWLYSDGEVRYESGLDAE